MTTHDDTSNIFSNREYCVYEISNVPRSVLRDISVRVIMYIKLVVSNLVRGISLHAAQLFVIAIENILRGCVGNITSYGLGDYRALLRIYCTIRIHSTRLLWLRIRSHTVSRSP